MPTIPLSVRCLTGALTILLLSSSGGPVGNAGNARHLISTAVGPLPAPTSTAAQS